MLGGVFNKILQEGTIFKVSRLSLFSTILIGLQLVFACLLPTIAIYGKYRISLLENQIRSVTQAKQKAEYKLHAQIAEWSFLTSPQVIEKILVAEKAKFSDNEEFEYNLLAQNQQDFLEQDRIQFFEHINGKVFNQTKLYRGSYISSILNEGSLFTKNPNNDLASK